MELGSELKLFRPFQIRGIARPWTRLRGKQDGKVREVHFCNWRWIEFPSISTISLIFPFGVDFELPRLLKSKGVICH